MDVKEQVTPNEMENQTDEIEQWIATGKRDFEAKDYESALKAFNKAGPDNWRTTFYSLCCIALTSDTEKVVTLVQGLFNTADNIPTQIVAPYMVDEQIQASALPELIEYALLLEETLNILFERLKEHAISTGREGDKRAYRINKHMSIDILRALVGNWEEIDTFRNDERFVEFAASMHERLNEAVNMEEQLTSNKAGEKISDVERWMTTARQCFDVEDYTQAMEYYTKVIEDDAENWRALFYKMCCLALLCTMAEAEKCIEVLWNSSKDIPPMISLPHVMNGQIQASALPEFIEYALALEKTLNVMCERLREYAVTTENDEDKESCNAKTFSSIAILHSLVNNWEKIDTIRNDERFIEFAVSMYKRLNKNKVFVRGVNRWVDANGTLTGYAKMLLDPEISPIVPMSNYIRKYERTYCSPVEQAINRDKNKYKREQTQGTQGRPQPQAQTGGCYVATAVYGSYDCPEVWTLRRYRDETLGKTWYGRAFVKTYYTVSPTLVKWFGHTEWFKNMWRGKLDRMVQKLQNNGVENTPYEDKNW